MSEDNNSFFNFFDCGKRRGKCNNEEAITPCPHFVDDDDLWDRCCDRCERKKTCPDCCPIVKPTK